MLPTLRGARAMGLLDGTDAAPAPTLEVEDDQDPKKKKLVTNPGYIAWLERDQQVAGYLVNSLSPDVLAHVLGLETSVEIWSAITSMFASQSIYRVQHLRTSLNTTKKNNMTTTRYFTIMKGFRSELVAAGKPIDDAELVGYILNGLDGSYNGLVSSVNANPGTSLSDLYGQLNFHDMRQQMLAAERNPGPIADEFISSATGPQRPPTGPQRQLRQQAS